MSARALLGVALLSVLAVGFAAVVGVAGSGEERGRPVKVTIQDEKPVVVETILPIDPTPRIKYNPGALSAQIRTEQNQSLHLSNTTILKIDDQVMPVGIGGGAVIANQPLPRSPGGRVRQGFTSVYKHGDLRITMVAELSPTKPQDKAQKREMGAMVFRYTVENTGQRPHTFGLKAYYDMYVVTNDGALFAAPTTHPGKILDGIELKDKTLPPYVQCLQNPDLKNPGYIAHYTLDLGSSVEKPSRIVLTSLGAGAFNAWDTPAIQAGGDSAVAVFFDPKEIKPGGKREFAYAYGKGVAIPLESEGAVDVRFAGSFEPGRSFTVTALINDPPVGQSLTLELPKGIALLEGRDIQPVPQPVSDPPQSIVQWKCRVLELGRFPLRLRSSTGVTQTKIVSVSRAE